MKRFFAFLALTLLLTGCSDKGWNGACARCEEYGDLAGSCPCCGAPLCESCWYDAKDFLDDTWDSAYEDGFSNGAIDGYAEGYEDGAEDGYENGYSDAIINYGIEPD